MLSADKGKIPTIGKSYPYSIGENPEAGLHYFENLTKNTSKIFGFSAFIVVYMSS